MEKRLELDFKEILASDHCEQFRGKSFLITGATGLIGSLLTKFLIYVNKTKSLDIQIYAAVRNLEKAQVIFQEHMDRHLSFLHLDFDHPTPVPDIAVDYIVHTAAVTTSKTMVSKPVETLLGSINGTDTMLRLARRTGASILYLSSMEAYGTIDDSGKKATEEELGYIDLSNVRSCYPESKRLCECLCRSYHEQYHVRAVSGRLAQTFGAGVMPQENRVFAQFARSAMNGQPIVLHTLGKSEGNYIYTADAIRAILFLLVNGAAGETYNITNEKNHMTIADMAALVAQTIGNGQCKVVFDIPENGNAYGYAPDTKLFMSSQKIHGLGWFAQVGLKEAYERLCDYFLETA